MKTMLLVGLLGLASVAADARTAPLPAAAPAPSAPVAAPAPDDVDPALWVVRDEDTTIYLFGTFHLLDDRAWFNDEVKAAFDASNELVLEAIVPEDPGELQPMVLRYAVDPQGRRLSQRLNAEQNAALGRALATIGAPAAAFEALEPWFASMTLAAMAAERLGISPDNGPEAVLARAARQRNIPVSELEGMEWQLRLFDTMPEEQQMAQLRETLDQFDGLADVLEPMLAAWSAGDVDRLRRLVDAEGESNPTLHRILFTDRNATWADWVQQRLARPGAVFLAVGAGHLAGANSVQTVLQARGIRSERVPPPDERAPHEEAPVPAI